MSNSLRMYLGMMLRHPRLFVHFLRHPSLSELRSRGRELDLKPIKSASVNKEEKTFVFNNIDYEYFYNDYNKTWSSERTVEVPIIWRVLQENPNSKILEVGNVLSHYFKTKHTILDKFEQAPGVINQDIVEFSPPTKFDLIVSISTLEHVGWSTKREEERDQAKFSKAIEKILSLLNPEGKIWFTVPLGYNEFLDDDLRNNRLKLDGMYFLKRISADNRWKQCGYDEVRDSVYGGFTITATKNPPFPKANAIMVGLLIAK